MGQNLSVTGLSGFGIASPTEKLDVDGSIKASQSLIANQLTVSDAEIASDVMIGKDLKVTGNILSESFETNLFTLGSGSITEGLTIGQDLISNGNIGIGVASPTEKLDVAGNIKSSGSISAQSLDIEEFNSENGSFSGNLSVGQNLSVTGLSGFGVANPTEKLDVAGSVKASQSLIANQLNVTDAEIASNLTVGEDLRVTGNIISESLESNAYTGANGTFTQSLSIGQNLLANGNVGIGVPVPTEKLDVLGNIKASGNISAQSIDIAQFNSDNGNFTGNVSVAQNLSVNGLTGLGVATPSEKLDVDGNIKASQSLMANDLNVTNAGITSSLTVGDNLFITSGNVGIGITDPTEKLEVAGKIVALGLSANEISVFDAEFTGDVSIVQSLTVSGTSDFTGEVTVGDITILNNMDLQNDLAVGGTLGVNVASPQATLHVGGNGIFDGNITAVKLIVQELEVANLDFTNQQGSQVAFEQDLFVEGSVGIGTEKIAGYKLSVNGKIRASDDIKVYPSGEWADYVFDDNYELASLNEVEAYIGKNNHLPGMPSSEEVKASGINLGEMDAKLLEKVEELTLYMLELKKENKKLSSEVAELKALVTR